MPEIAWRPLELQEATHFLCNHYLRNYHHHSLRPNG